jgi:hypothetical protein
VRQPMQYSAFTNTAYAVRALQVYGPAGRKSEYARRNERARAWLVSQNPGQNEDRVKRLIALLWAGAEPNARRAPASQLLAGQ